MSFSKDFLDLVGISAVNVVLYHFSKLVDVFGKHVLDVDEGIGAYSAFGIEFILFIFHGSWSFSFANVVEALHLWVRVGFFELGLQEIG